MLKYKESSTKQSLNLSVQRRKSDPTFTELHGLDKLGVTEILVV